MESGGRIAPDDQSRAMIVGDLLRRFIVAHDLLNRAGPEHGTGLRGQQARAVIYLAQHDGATVSALGGALGLSDPRASRLVSELVEAGHVLREEDTADRRRLHLRLAPGTKQMARAMYRERSQATLTALAGLSADDVETLARLLRPVVEEFEHRASGIGGTKGRGATDPQ